MNLKGVRGIAVALVAVGALALAGCSGAGGGSDAKGGSFTYWSMWSEKEPQAKVIDAAIKAYEKETGAKVTVQWQGRNVLDQVTAGLAAGKTPDLVDQGYDKLGTALNSQDALADLSDVWGMTNADGKKVADVVNKSYVEKIPAYGGSSNKYLIPYTVSTVSLFYNANSPYVKEAPASYDDLLKDCAAAKAAGVGCIVSDSDAIWAAEYWFDYLLNRNAGDGAMKKLAEDKTGAEWDSAAVKKIAEQVHQLITDGYMVSGYDASQYPAGETAWAQGQGVFYLTGSWVTAETAKTIGADWKYAGANFPSTGGSSADGVSVLPFGFAVPTAAKNADAAKAFIAYFSSEKYEGKIATEASNLTALKDGQAPAELASVQEVLSKAAPRVTFDGEGGNYFSKVFDPAFGDLWLGKTTADQFVANGKAAHVQYWKAQG
ncbi:ABC transporter substrate-binding protein [Microbacterium sp. 2MCAF23]|uniref:ABC transporter substrate-binding protein n=1 Tax=Microbacterium sp. 2MCAF23 TaxID=3232985 RepID=UPI003F9B6EFE